MSRKTPLTEEHKKECAALKRIWLDRKGKLTHDKVAEKFSVSTGAIAQYLNGHTKLNLAILLKFANLLDFDPCEVSKRICDENISINNHHNKDINYDNIGNAHHNEEGGKVPEITMAQATDFNEETDIYEEGYAKKWHRKIKGGDNTYVVEIIGNSNHAKDGISLQEGMIAFIDYDLRTPKNDDMVIAKLLNNNTTTIKQFKTGENKPYLHPLNTDHHDIYDDFEVLGTVIFSGWDFN